MRKIKLRYMWIKLELLTKEVSDRHLLTEIINLQDDIEDKLKEE